MTVGAVKRAYLGLAGGHCGGNGNRVLRWINCRMGLCVVAPFIAPLVVFETLGQVCFRLLRGTNLCKTAQRLMRKHLLVFILLQQI
jgi:hypothetical protein